MGICGRIEDVLAREQLELFAQPVVHLGTGDVVFDELLLRMRTPSGRVSGPGELLAQAEREGTITQVDEWVLRRAATIAESARPVSVNVSGHSVSDPAFLTTVEEMLGDRIIAPGRYTIEITETALMHDVIQAARFADRLQARGCQFALDDFGTGYAALTYLKHLPIRYLKIDMSFVRDLVHDTRSQALVSGIVALARGFGQETVAEGVEDGETMELVRRLGVDLAQGFFIGAPCAT